MKLKKILKILFGATVLLIVLVTLTVLFWLGPTVKLIAQNIGTKALGTPLTIHSLSINPRKGTFHLSNFAIANPNTFGQSNAVSLASLDIALDMGSLFSQTVVVHQVTINSPHFIYEQSSATDNLNEFILSIQEFIGHDPSAPANPPDPKQEEIKRRKAAEKAEKNQDKIPKVIVVESLVLNDVKFHLANTDHKQLDLEMGFKQLSVSMTNGVVQLDQLYISNPGRLETPNLFSLEQFSLLLEPEGIYSGPLNIHAIHLRKPHVFVEYNPETDTLGEFLKIAETLLAKLPTNRLETAATHERTRLEGAPEPDAAPAKEIILGPITIEDIQFHVVNIGDPDLSVHFGLNQLVVSLEDGSLQLDHLYFTNPKRLNTPNLFSLEGIHVDFDPDSLGAETLVFKDIQIKQPYAFLELNPDANTLSAFIEIANGFIDRIPTYPIPEMPELAARPESTTAPASPAAPPFELHNLLVDDLQVQLLDSTATNSTATEPHVIAQIDEILIKLVEGNLQINNITIPNVKGFLATNLFHLAHIGIEIQPASIFSDQIIIDHIFIDSPKLNLEQTEESGNVAALQHQFLPFIPSPSDQPEVVQKETVESEMKSNPIPLSEQPIVLHQLVVTNLTVHLKLPVSSTNENFSLMKDTLGILKPMERLASLNKLNPLASQENDAEEEIDPNAPMELLVLNWLSLEPLKGLLQMKGLHISNPPTFSKRDLINLEELRLEVQLDSLQTDTLVIQDILISRPRIRYERKIKSDNIKALQKEIEQVIVRRDEIHPQSEKDSDAQEGQKVIIEHILITKGLVSAKLSALPAIPLPLPDIEMNDIGKKDGGTSISEASSTVFNTFYEALISSIGNATGFAGDTVKNIGSFGLGALGDLASGITNSIGKVTDKITGESEETAEE
ncbi:MAG: hypothetical protein V5783_05555 [Pontiella sp.]